MGRGDFWNDRRSAEEVSRQARGLRDVIEPWDGLKSRLDDLLELRELASAEADAATLSEVEAEAAALGRELDQVELQAMLADEDDPKDAILEIHSGAGGTEAADWAGMLMRLYGRWIERRGFESDLMDLQPGDEAGIKSATIEVRGRYAYGYLKAEAGVHRLVRISPFDANKRRHTSFASVFVYPEVDEIPEVELREDDLQIDTYKAGGAGGQHVNKTSSAVRITSAGRVGESSRDRTLRSWVVFRPVTKGRVAAEFSFSSSARPSADAVRSVALVSALAGARPTI